MGVGYCDLNIPIGPKCQDVVRRAVKCGYLTLAINTPILTRDVATSGGKKGGKKRKWEERSGGLLATTAASLAKGQPSNGFPPPPANPWINQLINETPGLRILQRLTLIFSDVNQLQLVLSQPGVKLYDIIAILPTNHDVLQASLNSTAMTFDMVSFDFEGPHWIQKLRLNRQKGDLAASKEIYFELTYASSMRGDTALENLIYTAHSLLENVCVKRIKNLILTSGAGSPLEVKSPKDVLSIGYLLSLDEGTSRVSFREATNRIIDKTEARKFGKAWAAFLPADAAPNNVENKKGA